jgi:hypothetical protein
MKALENVLILFGFRPEPIRLNPVGELPGTLGYHARMNRCAHPDVDSEAGTANVCVLVLDAKRTGRWTIYNHEIGG